MTELRRDTPRTCPKSLGSTQARRAGRQMKAGRACLQTGPSLPAPGCCSQATVLGGPQSHLGHPHPDLSPLPGAGCLGLDPHSSGWQDLASAPRGPPGEAPARLLSGTRIVVGLEPLLGSWFVFELRFLPQQGVGSAGS